MRARVLGFVLLLAALPIVARAQCGDLNAKPANAEDAAAKLDALETAGCLGGNACPLPVCKHFTTWHQTKDGPGALELLTDIRNTATEAGSSTNIQHLVGKIDEWIDVVSRDAAALSAPAQWKQDNGRLFPGTPSEVVVDPMAFQEATAIVTAATLVRRINNDLTESERTTFKKYVEGLDQRWEDYFAKSPAQFPWELAINSIIYRKHERRGYNEPPSWQLIAVHPAAAYEYASDAADKFKSALALDAIGYYRGHLGASLAAAWADRSDANKFGYGATLHWEGKVTVGVIHHGGAGGTTILVSPSVEKFITGKVKKAKDLITKAKSH